jgi:hypothetical protein
MIVRGLLPTTWMAGPLAAQTSNQMSDPCWSLRCAAIAMVIEGAGEASRERLVSQPRAGRDNGGLELARSAHQRPPALAAQSRVRPPMRSTVTSCRNGTVFDLKGEAI